MEGHSDAYAERFALLEAQLEQVAEGYRMREAQAAEREKSLQAQVEALQRQLRLVQLNSARWVSTRAPVVFRLIVQTIAWCW